MDCEMIQQWTFAGANAKFPFDHILQEINTFAAYTINSTANDISIYLDKRSPAAAVIVGALICRRTESASVTFGVIYVLSLSL